MRRSASMSLWYVYASQTSLISRILVGNKMVDHSDVVGASCRRYSKD